MKNGKTINMLEFYRFQKRRDELDKDISASETTYNTLQEQLQEYLYNIGNYEKNYALVHEEKYDEISNVNYEYVKNLEDASDQQKTIIEQQIANEKTNLEQLKDLKEKNNTDIYDSQIEASEKQLAKLDEDLKAHTSIIEIGNQNNLNAWKEGLANQLSEILGKNVEFKEAGDEQVQLYVDGVKQGQPIAELAMSKFATDIINQVNSKKIDAETAGNNLLNGFNSGLNNMSLRATIKNSIDSVGSETLNTLQESLDEHSPSRATRQMGEYLLDGINNGIRNQDKRNSIFNSISSFGSNILSKLKKSLDEHSPSKATRQMGEYLLQGLGLGISDEEDSVIKQVSRFGENVIDAFSFDNINMPERLNLAIDANSNLIPENFKTNNISNKTNVINYTNKIDTLINLAENYFPKLLQASQKNIIMDTGAFVGSTAPAMNEEFAKIKYKNERGG